MDEKTLLENFAKMFGQEQTLTDLEEQKKKQEELRLQEQKLLEHFNTSLGILVENNPEHAETIIEEVIAATPTPIVEMGRQPEPELPVKDIVSRSVEMLSKAKQSDIQQAADTLPNGVRKELDIIKKSITDLHRFASRHSQMGGGGEVKLRYLDDVDRSTIYQGHFLTYDNSTKKFVFSQIAEGNVDLSHIDQSLMPGANGVYNLGSPTDYWSNVYADTLFLDGGGLNANGSFGSNGQTLTSNGTSVYWSTPSVDWLHVPSDIIPVTDNTYSLGNTTNRWQSVHIGPGTLYIQDQSNSSLNAALTVNNGVLQINGSNQLQVGQLKFVNNNIQSTTSNVDIQIGQTTDTANLVIDRNMFMANNKSITFGDNTTQNTAYIPNINTPRIISGTANTITIDFSTDTTIHLHTNAGTVTANLINFTAGKQVDVIVYNNIGGTQQYNHGLSTSNRAVGGSSFFLCSHPTMWVTYICEDNTETNCFVKAAV